MDKNQTIADGGHSFEGSLAEIERLAVCVVKETYSTSLVNTEKDYYEIQNKSTDVSSGQFYADKLCAFLKIYATESISNFKGTLSVKSPVPRANSNSVFYCVVLMGETDEKVKQNLRDISILISQKLVPQLDISDSNKCHDFSALECIEDALDEFLEKNSAKKTNSRFSVGVDFNSDNHIDIGMYNLVESKNGGTEKLEGFALQNGYNEVESVIYLLVFNDEKLDSCKKYKFIFPNTNYINILIEARQKGLLLKFKAARTKDSQTFKLIEMNVSNIRATKKIRNNSKNNDKKTIDMPI